MGLLAFPAYLALAQGPHLVIASPNCGSHCRGDHVKAPTRHEQDDLQSMLQTMVHIQAEKLEAPQLNVDVDRLYNHNSTAASGSSNASASTKSEAPKHAINNASHRVVRVMTSPLDNATWIGETATIAMAGVLPEADPASINAVFMRLRNAAAILGLCAVLVGAVLVMLGRHRAKDSTGIRQRAEQVRLTSAAEIRKMLGINTGSGDEPWPLSPGKLMRIQGRIVVKDKPLTAPISSRPCVMYSASVSHCSQDGVHQPPMAFQSTGVDFAIEILGPQPLTVNVHSNDTILFDMVGGRYACEETFAEASENQVGFIFEHLTADAGKQSNVMNRPENSFEGTLEFRECALVTGAVVTVLGEITRDRDGTLQLCPWRPNLPWKTPSSRELSRCGQGLFVEERQERDCLAGRVLLTDDPSMLVGGGSQMAVAATVPRRVHWLFAGS